MKIIAVNINKGIDMHMDFKSATERAWLLNLEKCKKYDFVIGVSFGEIKVYYKLIDVTYDRHEIERVCFDLIPCNNSEISTIIKYIYRNKINLNRIVVKYIN